MWEDWNLIGKIPIDHSVGAVFERWSIFSSIFNRWFNFYSGKTDNYYCCLNKFIGHCLKWSSKEETIKLEFSVHLGKLILYLKERFLFIVVVGKTFVSFKEISFLALSL